jgi:hypothetical protein
MDMAHKISRLAAAVGLGCAFVVAGFASPAHAATGPDLSLAQTWTPANPTASDVIAFTYTITNHGDAPATNAHLEIDVNLGRRDWTVVSGCGALKEYPETNAPGSYSPYQEEMECGLGTIAPGRSVTKVVRYTAKPFPRYSRSARTWCDQLEPSYAGNYVANQVGVAPSAGGANGLQSLLGALLALLHL